MRCKVLKQFPYAKDGIDVKNVRPGEVVDFDASIVGGLIEAGMVEEATEEKDAGPAPKNKALKGAPENKSKRKRQHG